jgi:hypothetical protein
MVKSITALRNLKTDLDILTGDNAGSYCRINQPSARTLLNEIVQLEKENANMKEQLEKINAILKN